MRKLLRTFAIGIVLLAVAGAAYQHVMERREAAHFPPPGTMVDIGGRRLHLVCSGVGSPTVILEASGLGTVLLYEQVQRKLARTNRVCAYDRAGLGWSEPEQRAATARNLAADLDALLHAGRLEPPYILVASSAGGLTMELFAREHPQGVAGLVWLDALSAAMIEDLPELQRLQRTACFAHTASWFGLPRVADPLGLRRLPELQRDRAVALTYRTHTLAVVCSLTRSFAASAQQIQAAPPLPATIPIAVLVHEDPEGLVPGATVEQLAAFEPRWREAQRKFARRSACGEFLVVTDSRHLIAEEQPSAVVRAVRRVQVTATAQPENECVPNGDTPHFPAKGDAPAVESQNG